MFETACIVKLIFIILSYVPVSPIGLAGILLIMYVETFQTAVIIFVCNIIMHLMSVLSHLTDNFQYQSQFVNILHFRLPVYQQ
jgi:hypothetical protein